MKCDGNILIENVNREMIMAELEQEIISLQDLAIKRINRIDRGSL